MGAFWTLPRVKCCFCEESRSFSTIAKHRESCFLNPKNIRCCAVCSKVLKNKKSIYCSIKCRGRNVAQCTPEYWTEERKKIHGERVKTDKYREGIKNRNCSGVHNSMFGKKLTESTRQKMSIARTGKTGSNATNWQGGKMSVARLVKGFIHRTSNWYKRVYQRDGFKCSVCGSKTKIDAHHIKSISRIIKDLTKGITFESSQDKVAWLIKQPEVIDTELHNGITLCRLCHKKAHKNWGSHEA